MSDNEITIRVTAHNSTTRGLDAAKAQARAAGNDIAQTLTRAGEQAGDGFRRGVDGRLRDVRGRFAKEGAHAGDEFAKGLSDKLGGKDGRSFFGRLFDGLADQANNVADAVGKSLAQIPVALSGLAGSTVATGGINLLVIALLALAAAAAVAVAGLILLAPVLYLLGGSMAATITTGVGLVSVIGTLIVGMGGLGDAWSAYGQKASGGGRSAADAAHQVMSATWALADAQRSALRAQEDIGRAREAEAERLEDLSRSLADARLDEEGAVLAVRRAEERLREARRHGSGLDVAEALLGYKRAVAAVSAVQDRVGDLAKEQDEANRKGVEGSDRVQDALERQRQAQHQLTQATWALAQAQRGAGGGVDKFAEAMAKLSPNARSFMETMFRLRDSFAGIKRDVQDKLFEGLDKAVSRLATQSFPTLRKILGDTATSLNGFAKGAMEALGKSTFLNNMQVAAAGFNRWLDRIGTTSIPKLIDAIGRLAAKSMPFFEEFGDMLAGWIEKFSDWIAEADKTGDLDRFFKDAAESLKTIRDIGGTALKIIGQIVEILFPASKRESEGFLAGVSDQLHEWSDWLKDPENQQKIRDWIKNVQDFGDKIGETVDKVVSIIDIVDRWTTRLDKFVSFFTELPGRIKTAAKGMWDGIKDAFKAALNWIVEKWNSLSFSLPSVNFLGRTVGGGTIDTPDIPRLDHGGIAGGLVRVAERAREAISMPGGGQLLALPQGSMVHPNGGTESMLGGRNGVNVNVNVGFKSGAESKFVRLLREIVEIYGDGDVQSALGRKRSS